VPQPLKLAYLADPNSVHTRRWIGFFADRGHAVHLLVGEEDEVAPGLAPGIEIHRYRRFSRRRLPFVSSIQGRVALKRVLSSIRPDVLHAHYLTRYGWQGRLSGFHPFVVSPWGSDLYVTPRSSFRARIWARLTLRGADLVTVVSSHMAARVRAAGVQEHRIVMVSFGVDTGRYAPAAAPPVLDDVGVPAGRRVVFSPRSIRPIYRPDVVIEAFAMLGGDAVLVMTARAAVPASLAEVHRRIATHDIAHRVRLLDEIDDDLMLRLFQRADVVLSIPESDGIPISVLEAMACGRPVVATDVPGPRELLAPSDERVLVPVGDADATARALRQVLDLPAAEVTALGEANRERVLQDADRQRSMERMEQLYAALRLAER